MELRGGGGGETGLFSSLHSLCTPLIPPLQQYLPHLLFAKKPAREKNFTGAALVSEYPGHIADNKFSWLFWHLHRGMLTHYRNTVHTINAFQVSCTYNKLRSRVKGIF